MEIDQNLAQNIDSAVEELDRIFTHFYLPDLPLEEFRARLEPCLDELHTFAKSAGLTLDEEIKLYYTSQPDSDIKEGVVLPTFNFAEFLTYEPAPEKFLIEGILPENTPAVLYGTGGVGKSYLTIQQAVSLATGLPYLDRFEVKEKRQVLIIAQEDSKNQIHLRIKRILEHLCEVHGLNPKDLAEDLKNIVAVDFSQLRKDHRKMKRNLTDPSEEFFNSIKQTVNTLGNVGLIIADPLNKLYGSDMNANDLATEFMLRIEDLCETLDVTIEIIHHKNKTSDSVKFRSYGAGGSMGAASFINGARHAIEVDKANKQNDKIPSEDRGNTFLHNISKSNYMADGDDRIFYMRKNDNGVLYYFDIEKLRIEREKNQERLQLERQEDLALKCRTALDRGPLRKMAFYEAIGYEKSTGAKKLKEALTLELVTLDEKGQVTLNGN